MCYLMLPPKYKNADLQEQHLQSSIIFCCCMSLLRYAQLDITYVNAVESALKPYYNSYSVEETLSLVTCMIGCYGLKSLICVMVTNGETLLTLDIGLFKKM